MAIRWDKFTIKAQEAIQQANEIARAATAIRKCCRCICWRGCCRIAKALLRPFWPSWESTLQRFSRR